jgi:protein phosphatase
MRTKRRPTPPRGSQSPKKGGRAVATTEADKPRHSDIDAWGLTHPGKVRKTNQDHYFLGSLSRGVIVDGTSHGDLVDEMSEQERLASLVVVADGVGSSRVGGSASQLAVRALVEEVAASFHDAYHREASDPEVFTRLLHDAALACHASLLKRAAEEPDKGRFATTLTLFLGLWPHAYLLQVGDSRCYIFRDGELTQISRDQTWAQELIEQGVLTHTKAHSSQWANVLSSAIGGQQAAPVVTRIVRDWGTVVLLCSDGLTKHVSDEQIAERVANMRNSRQVCEDLLQDALDDGGTDNVTIVVGRTVPPRVR